MEQKQTWLKSLVLKMLPERILAPLKRRHYARVVSHCSEQDEPDLAIVTHLVKLGDCVIDIGANIGTYTKFLSRWVGSTGRVYSIEPVPLTFGFLKHNVEALHLENVDLLNCAISDRQGIVLMEVPTWERGGHNFYMARVTAQRSSASRKFLRVPCDTLSSLFGNLRREIAFVKCDVEGHELECIQGALGFFATQKPAWLLELSGDPDESASRAAQVVHLLEREGYRAYVFDGKRVNERLPGDTSVNYFFLAEAHRARLRLEGLIGREAQGRL